MLCVVFFPIYRMIMLIFSLGTIYPYRNKPWYDFYEIELATKLDKIRHWWRPCQNVEWRQRFSYDFIQELLILKREQCNDIQFDWLVYIFRCYFISYYHFFFTEYRILGKKGEGTFSEVLKCQHIKDGTYWACKKMKQTYER